MNMQKKFAEKKQEATKQIKELLWQDTDNDDKVIEVANLAGIAPEKVQEWASEIEGAKEQKSEVANVDMDQLREDAKRTFSAAKSANTKAQNAIQIRNQKQQAADQARRELDDATMGIEDLARELYRINSPQDQIPPECRAIHEAHRMAERRDEQRTILRKHEKSVQTLTEQLELLDGVDTQTEHGEMVLRGPDLVPRGQATEQQREAVESRLQKAQKNADDATKVLQGLEQKVQDARSEAGM